MQVMIIAAHLQSGKGQGHAKMIMHARFCLLVGKHAAQCVLWYDKLSGTNYSLWRSSEIDNVKVSLEEIAASAKYSTWIHLI